MPRPPRAVPWSNRLGHSVATRHGEATVADAVHYLYVSVPLAPGREWVESPLVGPARWRTIDRHRVCRVPFGTDPIEAVRLCRADGEARERGDDGAGEPVMLEELELTNNQPGELR